MGLIPLGIIWFDTRKPSNRTTGKRWPTAEIHGDVRLIDTEMFRRYVPLEELHLWASFPCTDLSSVRHGRRGLDGPASGLFWEVVRIKKLIKHEAPPHIKVKFSTENVASMDKQQCEEITQESGVRSFPLSFQLQ